MNRLSQMVFDDSSSQEDEEDVDDFKIVNVMIVNEDFRGPR